VTQGSRLTMKQRILPAAICAAVLGGVPVASNAADLGPISGAGTKHVRTSRTYGNWLQRCAYAGYYCLYAEYGYVYHYPFDDRPVAYSHSRRRFR
jgi:carbohydrate-selective porin OprB